MDKNKKKITVTKPYLPPLEEYTAYLRSIWKTRWLTNDGPLVLELERKLKEYLGVKHLFFVSNGTIALQIAIRSLGIHKKIITTPFSFIATTTAILWENCEPVFVDIDPVDFCLDPLKIEKAISADTEAIMPVHIYGYPCNVDAIDKIAQKHKLKVIYDAAQSFGAKIGDKSVLSYGDISILSFHATKLFYTAEGGALVTNNDDLARKISRSRNFGYEGDALRSVGINAKNSEFHAALGLCNLSGVRKFIQKRKKLVERYDSILKSHEIHRPAIGKDVDYNYAYYPIVFDSEETAIRVKDVLEQNNIFPRRYFYPSLNKLPYLESKHCPVSESVSTRVLCLPVYHDLSLRDVTRIAKLVVKSLNNFPSKKLEIRKVSP